MVPDPAGSGALTSVRHVSSAPSRCPAVLGPSGQARSSPGSSQARMILFPSGARLRPLRGRECEGKRAPWVQESVGVGRGRVCGLREFAPQGGVRSSFHVTAFQNRLHPRTEGIEAQTDRESRNRQVNTNETNVFKENQT